jgi:tRNA A-37 threonylcarbamoyl transferase component Bud32
VRIVGFEIAECLGRGGFAEVYRANAVDPDGVRRPVALKVLRRDVDPAAQSAERLRDEARWLAALRHPAILRVFDLVTVRGQLGVVSELVDGADLSAVFRMGLPRRALLDAVAQVAAGLHAAATARGPDGAPLGLVHRDIKPSNLRISRHGELRILDFGIAHAAGPREARTATDVIPGTVCYLAPERFLSADVQASSDVFALGAVWYEGLVGERLQRDLSFPVLAANALDPDRYAAFLGGRLAKLPADLDPSERALLAATLTAAPRERPTADAVARALEEVVDRAGGPDLAQWARGVVWPAPEAVMGDWPRGYLPVDGHPAAAASVAPAVSVAATVVHPVHRPAQQVARAGWRRWAAGGAAVGGLGAVALAAGGVGAAALWWSASAADAPAEAPAAVAAPLPVAASPGDARDAAADASPPPVVSDAPRHPPSPQPEPMSPDPSADGPAEPPPVVEAPAAADPVAPAPAVPVAPAAPRGPRLGTVRAVGVAAAEVRGPVRAGLPAEVPPGTYALWVQREAAGAWTLAGEFNVVPGAAVVARCNPRLATCTIQ